MKTSHRVYLALWAVFLSIFVFDTAPKLWTNLRNGHVIAPSPTASIDTLLTPVLEIRQPGARLIAAAARIPSAQRTAFVSRKDDARCDFVYSALCYLTFPRKIDKVEVAPNDSISPAPFHDAAVFVCGMRNDLGDAQSLGPQLTLRIP